MENKKLVWIVSICVFILAILIGILAYVYRDEIKSLFSRASVTTQLDWGGYHQGAHPYYPCLAPVRTQLGQTFSFDTEERFKLYNRGTDPSAVTNVVLSSDLATLLDSNSVTVSGGTYNASTKIWTTPVIQPGGWAFIRVKQDGVTAQAFSLSAGSISTECRTSDYFPLLGSSPTPNPTPTPTPEPINDGTPTINLGGTDIPPVIKAGTQPDADVKGVQSLEQVTSISGTIKKNTTGALITPPGGTTTTPPSGEQCAINANQAGSLAVSGRVLKNQAVVNVAGEGTTYHCVTLRFTIFKLGPNDEVLPYAAQDDIETKSFNLGFGTHYLSLSALPCSFQSDLYYPDSTSPIAYDWLEHGCGTPPPTQETLTCAPQNQSIAAGGSANFTATGSGNSANYVWDTTGDNPTKAPTGPSATFSFGTPGKFTVTVHSGTITSSCNVEVSATPPTTTPTLTCSPASQNAEIGKPVSFTSTYTPSGSAGLSYRWTATDGSPVNGLANNFTTTFLASDPDNTAGKVKPVKVEVGGLTATCNVTLSAVPVNPTLTCSPTSQNAEIGKPVSFTSTYTPSGSAGLSYRWTAQDGSPASGASNNFSTTFLASDPDNTASKVKPVVVEVGGLTATCNVTLTSIVIVTEQADLSLTKDVSNRSPVVNAQVTYSIVITNSGKNDATGVSVKDVLPSGVSFVSLPANSPSQGSYSSTTGVWTIGALNVGRNATLQITVQVNQTGSITNTAEVLSSSLPDPDSTPNNNVASEDDQASVTITATSGGGGGSPTLTCSPSSQTVYTNDNASLTASGGTGSYTWSAPGSNTTSGSASSFTTSYTSTGTKTISLTSGSQSTNCTVIVNSPPGGGGGGSTLSCSPNAQVVTVGQTVNLNAINGSSTYTWSAPGSNTVSGSNQSFSTSYTTTGAKSVTVTSGGAQAVCAVTVNAGYADLSLTKSANNSSPAVGSQLTYTINIVNNGPLGATGVSVKDLIPSQLTYVSSVPSQGSYDSSSGIWTVGSLSSLASATLQITTKVKSADSIINTAEVYSSDQPDPDSTPNNGVPSEDDFGQVTVSSKGVPALPNAGSETTAPIAVGIIFILLAIIIRFFARKTPVTAVANSGETSVSSFTRFD